MLRSSRSHIARLARCVAPKQQPQLRCNSMAALAQRPSAIAGSNVAIPSNAAAATSSWSAQGSSQQTRTHQYSTTSAALKDDYPEHIVFPMPALSPTMEMGTIAGWTLKEGDAFAAGDVLCSVETDKATVDFEAQDDGILAKILKSGDEAVDLKVGTPICVVVEEEEDVAAFADYKAEELPADAAEDAPPASEGAPATAPAVSSTPSSPYPMMPSARFLAESKGLDATGLAGSGKGGRVTKGDVLSALSSGVALPSLAATAVATPATAAATPAAAVATPPPAAAPAPIKLADLANLPVDTHGGFEEVKNNSMRKIIAKRLTESKSQVPHFYTSVEVELDNVLKLRKHLAGNHDVKVSVNDLVIRCCALALRDVPEVNGTYDGKSDTVKLQDSVDVSVAVATPTGLITPIVPATDTLGLGEINAAVKDLATRARDGKLQPEEYQGGTFCVSNLGMFGINEFSAVINPPQAAILAVGTGARRIVPTPYEPGTPIEEQPKPQIKTIMTARLSADRRVVDEATASLFLSAFQQYISEPDLLLL